MTDIDEFSVLVFEQAKRFLEKAREAKSDDHRDPNLNAALLLGFCSLEAHLNSVAAELSIRKELDLLDMSILREKEIKFDDGAFQLSESLKIFRFEDRLEFVFSRFAKAKLPKQEAWWANLRAGIKLRNELVHPKTGSKLKMAEVERSLASILACINALYLGVFKKKYPGLNRALNSRLSF